MGEWRLRRDSNTSPLRDYNLEAMIVDCADRLHLCKLVKVADDELGFAREELFRLALRHSPRVAEYKVIVKKAIEHRERALANYLRHLTQHKCLEKHATANWRKSGKGSSN
jgi:hypothetical protein